MWSKWQKKFAWLPVRLDLTEEITDGMFSYTVQQGHRWVWLRQYWIRTKPSIVYNPLTNAQHLHTDHALDLFEIMRKT